MKKILIIEDDRILLETAADFLREEGYEVYKAFDGQNGIEEAIKVLPDLILCDIFMPKFDGYQVFSKLQTNIETSRIPFIFLTAKAEKEDIRYGMQLGADDYITKPLNFKELRKSIQIRLEKFEKTIKRSEVKYHALFELASDAILMIKPPKGEILDANKATLEMLGFVKSEVLCQSGYEIFAKDEFEKMIRFWEAETSQDAFTLMESVWKHKNGTLIPVQVSGKKIEILSEGFFLVIARNISEIKAKEEALRESEERYRDLVENTGEGLGVVDTHEIFTYANPAACEIFGMQADELIGKNLLSFLNEKSIQEINKQTEIRKQGGKSIYELEVKRPGGDIRWIIVTATGKYDKTGQFTGTFGIFRDITIRKLYEEELIVAKEKAEESDRLKSSILANMSHELRTPLNGILGFAEILKEELQDTEYENMVENIHGSGRRLMTTLNSIITLSQLEAGKISISVKEFSVMDGINSLMKSFGPMIKEKNIYLKPDGENPGSIFTDEHLIKQLLRQIIDNAIKFTDHGGITVHTSRKKESGKDWVVIRITDTGIGIDKDYFELIFQEFRQVSEGFGRKYQGSGIGLTISKKIIDLLEGIITLESKPGAGSTFSIWLPEKISPKPHQSNPQVIQRTNRPQVKKSAGEGLPMVLLVEDNQVNRELTEFFLKKVCLLEFVTDGETALEMVQKKSYDAILMDINLGLGMNGIETTRGIRKVSGYENTPIIAVTGYTMIDDKDKLLAEGCTHYIAKPFDRESIQALLREALSGQGNA